MKFLTADVVARIRRAQSSGRFVEFIRWQRYDDTITGYAAHCTPSSIVVEQLNWDTFSMDGLCLFSSSSVARIHVFGESEWPIRAARKLGLTKRVVTQWTKRSYSALLRDLAAKCQLVEVEQERLCPGALFLCEVLECGNARLRVRSYERSLENSQETTMLFRNITKVTSQSGYSRAATVALRQKVTAAEASKHKLLR
jgi:hypothetical protein